MPEKQVGKPDTFLERLQDRLVLKVDELVVVRPFIGRAGEEVRGRQLLLVADDNDLSRPQHATEGVLRPHLRRLVNYYEVEFDPVRRKKLRQRERRHHKARLERLDRPA